MENIIIYTNEACPYCKQIKEELNKNNIEFNERLTTDWKDEWIEISSLTNMPTVPTLICKDNYLVPGRDFHSAIHLVDIIKNINPFSEIYFSIERKTMEQLKTLTYHIHMAFSRTDQLLKQIETKLNKEE